MCGRSWIGSGCALNLNRSLALNIWLLLINLSEELRYLILIVNERYPVELNVNLELINKYVRINIKLSEDVRYLHNICGISR